jgi:hypothetical protein
MTSDRRGTERRQDDQQHLPIAEPFLKPVSLHLFFNCFLHVAFFR